MNGGPYRLKHLASLNARSLRDDEPEDLEFRYVDISSVGRGALVAEPQRMQFGDAPSRARRLVRNGDTIISTVRTYLRAVWPVAGPPDDLVVSTGFTVVSPGPRLDPRFFGWWAQSDACIEEIVARSVGVSYPAVSATDIGDLKIDVPGLSQQRDIARFLDAETARIDTAIEKKLQMVDLLDQRTWLALVHQVLHSESRNVPLRRALAAITDGPFGSAFTSADYSSDGAAVVRLGNIGFAEYRHDEQAFIPLSLYESFLQHRVFPGDLLIAGLGDTANHAGRACVAPDLGPAMVKGKCFCARVDTALASPEYLALLLSSQIGADAIGLVSRGSTRAMINLDIVKSTSIPLPRLNDQLAIVARTTFERERSEELRANLDRQIDLLRKRRQALITAAVSREFPVAKASP